MLIVFKNDVAYYGFFSKIDLFIFKGTQILDATINLIAMNQYFIHYFEKYLLQLKEEILAYQEEKRLWELSGEINNTGGNLCYHIIGFLNYYIGLGIGRTNYQRNRPLEFTIKDVPRKDLIDLIDATILMIREVLAEVDLEESYPFDFFQKEGSRAFFLFRVINHLSYHLGQINYHRRMLP